MPWAQILIGAVILVLGRQLFWLFVAAVGFLYGMDLAPRLFPGQPPEVVLLIGLLAGLIGAVFAYFLQWVAVAVAGFLVGGRLAMFLAAGATAATTSEITTIAFVIGGIIGAVIVLLFFNWALILLSATIGALMITEAIAPGSPLSLLLLAGLAAVGVVIQSAWLARRPATIQ